MKFRLKRKKPVTPDTQLPISPRLRRSIASWLVAHGYEDPVAVITRGWLVDIALDFGPSTAGRADLVAALGRTQIPAQFSISRLPLNLTSFTLRLAVDGLLINGSRPGVAP